MASNQGRREGGYTAIAAALRHQIETGDLAPGQELPSIRQIMDTWGVSQPTARAALRALAQQGLVDARQGAVARVRGYARIRSRRIQRLSPTQWGNSNGATIWDADIPGRNLRTDPVSVGLATPPPLVAVALGLPTDTEAVYRTRRFFVDDRPVQASTSWLPAALVTGTRIMEADTGPGGMYARLAEIGHSPAQYREEVVARMPASDEEATLDLRPGTPVLAVTRTVRDAAGTPVEVNQMLLDASVYVLDYTWTADAGSVD